MVAELVLTSSLTQRFCNSVERKNYYNYSLLQRGPTIFDLRTTFQKRKGFERLADHIKLFDTTRILWQFVLENQANFAADEILYFFAVVRIQEWLFSMSVSWINTA